MNGARRASSHRHCLVRIHEIDISCPFSVTQREIRWKRDRANECLQINWRFIPNIVSDRTPNVWRMHEVRSFHLNFPILVNESVAVRVSDQITELITFFGWHKMLVLSPRQRCLFTFRMVAEHRRGQFVFDGFLQMKHKFRQQSITFVAIAAQTPIGLPL